MHSGTPPFENPQSVGDSLADRLPRPVKLVAQGHSGCDETSAMQGDRCMDLAGRVSWDDNEPLGGASIEVRGPQRRRVRHWEYTESLHLLNSAVTDADGRFELEVEAGTRGRCRAATMSPPALPA